ncbi:MAG TPA: hypothetical protein VGF58_14045 [Burkholderiales bacterium]|jgi:hypothetical protein
MKATALLALTGLIAAGLVAALASEAGEPKSDDGHRGASGESVTGGRAVDCDAAGAVMRALEKLRPGETLSISGVCAQNVGVGERDAAIDALRTYGDRVTVRGATISGGRDKPSP